MGANNVILNLPFDESVDSQVAYDYSRNRADGQVYGASFAPGKSGNAIKFTGTDTCEIESNLLPSLNSDFSILFWANSSKIEVGTPKKMIWMLNFQGFNNYVEIPIDVHSGVWNFNAVTRRGSVINFYFNSSLVKVVDATDKVLQGISLNQDFFGGEYGVGLLDDVKVYDVALTKADLLNEQSANRRQAYYIDGIDLRDYGVHVSDSAGIVSKPKLKAPTTVSWDNYHGESVDLQHKFYEPREIVLSCFIKAGNKNEFMMKVSEFQHLFDKKGTNRLVVDVHPTKPLIYEVYCKDEISVEKTWNDALMVGTFKLKLIEPEPVKKILRHMRVNEYTKTCSIALSTRKMVNIFWGDGKVDYDVYGDDLTITHNYLTDGTFFPVITGCIEEIESFSTNAIIVWNRL